MYISLWTYCYCIKEDNYLPVAISEKKSNTTFRQNICYCCPLGGFQNQSWIYKGSIRFTNLMFTVIVQRPCCIDNKTNVVIQTRMDSIKLREGFYYNNSLFRLANGNGTSFFFVILEAKSTHLNRVWNYKMNNQSTGLLKKFPTKPQTLCQLSYWNKSQRNLNLWSNFSLFSFLPFFLASNRIPFDKLATDYL